MRKFALSGLFVAALSIQALTFAAANDRLVLAAQEDMGQGWDDLARGLRQWFGRWGHYFGVLGGREEKPLISIMLENREELGLSAEQVNSLEQLRRDFQRESIRRDADMRIAQMDLDTLLSASTVDMAKVEAKIREIERLRADVRIARIRTIEKGKQQLTAEQRKKLQEIVSESAPARSKPQAERGSPT